MFFAWPFFLFRCYGDKKLRIKRKTVIISNHYSTFDAFFIYLKFGYAKIKFVTIADVKKKVLPRFIAWLFDCLYLDYNTPNLGFFKQCIQILNDGGVICIFPEGVVNAAKYGFFDFKKSFAYLSEKTGADILPLYIFPEVKPFKISKFYIGELYRAEYLKCFGNLYDAATFFQCKIIEYSNLIDNKKGG